MFAKRWELLLEQRPPPDWYELALGAQTMHVLLGRRSVVAADMPSGRCAPAE